MFESICQAVAYAHAHDVIHRDLKPANVMVGGFGEVQVMDWGLAKVLTAGAEAEPAASLAETDIRTGRAADTPFTQAGSVLGTPAYIPPEQAAGEAGRVSKRSDVFGLGAILCALLTGKPPFEGPSSLATLLAAVRGDTKAAFARLDASAADPDAVALCKRCLALDPADRPADAGAMTAEVAALRSAADERARQAEREALQAEVRAAEQANRRRAVQRWAAGVAAVLLMGVAGTTNGLVRADAERRAALAANEVAQAERAEAEAARQAEAEQRQAAEASQVAALKSEADAKEQLHRANQVSRFVTDDILASARPEGQDGGLGINVTLRQALDAAAKKLEDRFKDDPLTEAVLRRTLGISYANLGQPEMARVMFSRTLELMKAKLGADHHDTLISMNNLASSLVALGRGAEAIPLLDDCLRRCASRTGDPRLIPFALDIRLQHFQKIGDPVGCRATAAMWEKQSRSDANSLYNAACWRAVTASAYAKADQPAEATADADRAMAWLANAVAAGYEDRAHMTADDDLKPLRERPDFRKLLASLPQPREVAPQPRTVARSSRWQPLPEVATRS